MDPQEPEPAPKRHIGSVQPYLQGSRSLPTHRQTDTQTTFCC